MSLCAATLARAHVRSVDPAILSGYLGDEGGPFVESITAFARTYADQSERDYDRLVEAIRKGELPAASSCRIQGTSVAKQGAVNTLDSVRTN